MNAKVKTALVGSALIVLIISIAGCTINPSVQPSVQPSGDSSAGGGGWGGNNVQASPSVGEPSIGGGSNVQASRSATAITITGYPSTVRAGQQYTITGRISAGDSGVPNAELHCYYYGSDGQWHPAPGCTFYTDGAGYWTFPDSWGDAGVHFMKFVYDGDSKYLPCESQALQITAT